MLRQEIEEQLAERLVNRIEETNAKVLTKIGEAIKQISTLNPSQAYQLSQILKYGGSYEEIAKELAKVSGKNVQDIYKIFDEVAKNNKQFAKDFYKYRGIDYIPYSKDIGLQNQVRSIASITAGTYMNIANTSAVGLVLGGDFVPLQQAYTGLIDKAIISVMQGKETFYTSMRDILKELGSNGLVQYQSGRTRRLDSAVRMSMLDGIRQLNKETTLRFGEEYNADGVEISVHSNPAPDHADIQGRQFSKDEFEKLEAGDIAKDIKGNIYDGSDKRQIGEYNCYHKIFNIVLGVSKPEYTDEQLEKIKEDNEKGFEYEGKHYTNYEGTQIQRRIETEIRKQKDIQILAKASGDMELVAESQAKITKLTHKYNDLCKVSGLKPKKQRMSVSGYVRTKVDNVKEIIKLKANEILITKKENEKLANFYIENWDKIKNTGFGIRDSFKKRYDELIQEKANGFKDEVIDLGTFEGCEKLLDKVNGKFIGEEIKNMDIDLVGEATKQIYETIQKCPALKRDTLNNVFSLEAKDLPITTFAQTRFTNIQLNSYWYKDKTKFIKELKDCLIEKEYVMGKNTWLSKVAQGNETKEIITHEIGHIVSKQISDEVSFQKIGLEHFENMITEKDEWGNIYVRSPRDIRKEMAEVPIRRIMEKENLTKKQVMNKYLSVYGHSDYEETLAEMFAQGQLGKSNKLSDEYMKYLKEIGQWEE